MCLGEFAPAAVVEVLFTVFIAVPSLILFIIFFAQPSFAIKIGLQTGVNKTYIGSSTKAEIIDCKTNKLIFIMDELKGYEFKPYKGQIAIKVNGEFKKINSNKIVIKPEEDGFVSVKKKWYRGHFQLVNNGSSLTVINDVPIEDYIQGVVPSEMPPAWEHEAHKAQAIAARSWAISNMNKRIKRGYNLLDTPMDQAYRGANAETRKTINKYLSYKDETAGAIMTPEFVRLKTSMNVEEALEKVRSQCEEAETINVLYVVDDKKVLKGVLTIKELLLGKIVV